MIVSERPSKLASLALGNTLAGASPSSAVSLNADFSRVDLRWISFSRRMSRWPPASLGGDRSTDGRLTSLYK